MFMNHFPGHLVTAYWSVKVTHQCISSGLSPNCTHAAYFYFTSVSLLSCRSLCSFSLYKRGLPISASQSCTMTENCKCLCWEGTLSEFKPRLAWIHLVCEWVPTYTWQHNPTDHHGHHHHSSSLCRFHSCGSTFPKEFPAASICRFLHFFYLPTGSSPSVITILRT
jgi:hypothetical protein